ncbi:MAG: hypothetical protein HC826_02095 [Rhodospirillales bacterium]|nr:hypothetical protein [Rhodospirillales bacterium]
MEQTRAFLSQLGLPTGDAYDLPSSPHTFPDGAHYRIEIPSVEGPRALVAVLAAYKDLASPWKELLDWYQQKEDARVKYDQLIEQFDPPGMLPETLQAIPGEEVEHLGAPVIASNLAYEDESGVRFVDGVSFQFNVSEHIVLVGAAAPVSMRWPSCWRACCCQPQER